MPYITYTATREIIAGHASNTSYSIVDANMQQIDTPLAVVKFVSTAIGGNSVSVLHRYEKRWVIKSDYIAKAALTTAGWYELIASTINGEALTFDPDSNIPGTPVNLRNCKVESSNLPQRESGSQFFSVSLTLIEVGYGYS